MNYSNSRVRDYGLLGDLYLIIDNLNWILLKTCQDKCECYGVLPHGEVEGVPIVVHWLETITWTRVRSLPLSGIHSTRLAKSKLALLQ